jgi:hypothetical protein
MIERFLGKCYLISKAILVFAGSQVTPGKVFIGKIAKIQLS